MWTLVFIIILSFLFLLTGIIIVLAISFGNYFLTKKGKEGEEEKPPATTKP